MAERGCEGPASAQRQRCSPRPPGWGQVQAWPEPGPSWTPRLASLSATGCSRRPPRKTTGDRTLVSPSPQGSERTNRCREGEAAAGTVSRQILSLSRPPCPRGVRLPGPPPPFHASRIRSFPGRKRCCSRRRWPGGGGRGGAPLGNHGAPSWCGRGEGTLIITSVQNSQGRQRRGGPGSRMAARRGAA